MPRRSLRKQKNPQTTAKTFSKNSQQVSPADIPPRPLPTTTPQNFRRPGQLQRHPQRTPHRYHRKATAKTASKICLATTTPQTPLEDIPKDTLKDIPREPQRHPQRGPQQYPPKSNRKDSPKTCLADMPWRLPLQAPCMGNPTDTLSAHPRRHLRPAKPPTNCKDPKTFENISKDITQDTCKDITNDTPRHTPKDVP